MSKPQNYNAADPEQIRNKKRKEERDQLRKEDAQRYVMGDVRGRLFVWSLLELCGVFRQPFTGNSETFFNCGRLNVGLRLMTDLETKTPQEFLSMWREHVEEKAKLSQEESASAEEKKDAL